MRSHDQRLIVASASLLVIALMIAVGCHVNADRVGPAALQNPRADVANSTNVPAARRQPMVAEPLAPSVPGRPMKRVPAIDSEPVIGVLLATGPQVGLTLPRAGVIDADGKRYPVPAGYLSVQATSGGLRCSVTGRTNLGADVIIRVKQIDGSPTFSAQLEPPFGKPQKLSFAGMPEVHFDRASRKAVLVERVGMETYLAGVLASEMNPAWPLEALKAQAVVARSYATDRYLQNLDQAWQLHWHYTVDMAYAGLRPLSPRTTAALEQTRGQILVYQGLPVPTLFCACSGGKTESARHFRPDLRGADGVTDMIAVMPVTEDPAAEPGAEALGFTASHMHWRGELAMSAISSSLQTWTREHPQDRPAFGSVEAVRIHDRFDDSGRVATVTVRHISGSHELDTVMSAADFRLAVGPGVIRSTDWSRCVTATQHGGVLVVEGRGYGHGVGMSQVSAYQMAHTGSGADDILKLFYHGANLVKRWP